MIDAPANPNVSVVIPAYNAAATLGAAIESVLEQTAEPCEVIVVDDGSRDQTRAVAEAFGDKVRVVTQMNAGCGEARNTGARLAVGDWLAFLDADDAWHPRKLEAQIPLTRDASVAVVTCRAQDKAGAAIPDRLSFDDLWPCNCLIVSSALVRRVAFERAGGFWSLRACEDYHLWLRLTASGWAIVNVPEDLVTYAPTATSLSRQIESFAAAEIACVRDIGERLDLPADRVRARVASVYLKHVYGAIHTRNLRLARRFAREALRQRWSLQHVAAAAVAALPSAVFDARRRMVGGAQA